MGCMVGDTSVRDQYHMGLQHSTTVSVGCSGSSSVCVRHGSNQQALPEDLPCLGLQFLDGWTSKLWSRFFCLSVYVTMYLNDHQRSAFYESLGLETTQFNRCLHSHNMILPHLAPLLFYMLYDHLAAVLTGDQLLGESLCSVCCRGKNDLISLGQRLKS